MTERTRRLGSWGWDRCWRRDGGRCLIHWLRALILISSSMGSSLLRLVSIISLRRVSVSRLLHLGSLWCLSMDSLGCNRLLVSCWGVGCMSTCGLLSSVAGMSARRLLQKAKNTTNMLLHR